MINTVPAEGVPTMPVLADTCKDIDPATWPDVGIAAVMCAAALGAWWIYARYYRR